MSVPSADVMLRLPRHSHSLSSAQQHHLRCPRDLSSLLVLLALLARFSCGRIESCTEPHVVLRCPPIPEATQYCRERTTCAAPCPVSKTATTSTATRGPSLAH